MDVSEVELEQELFDIPSEEHVENIIEGIADTLTGDIAGTEGLTKGQVYLSSVLVANGMIARNQAGVEGFLSKVGEGAKKAIEYLKKMFQSIWDFFFKRDAPKLVSDAKDGVKKTEAAIKRAETGGGSPEETKEVLQGMRKTVLMLTHDNQQNNAALNQILKEADEAMSKGQSEQKVVIKKIVEELPKLNSKKRTQIKKKLLDVVGDLRRAKDVFSSMEELDKEGNDKITREISRELKGAAGEFEKAGKALEALQDMKDLGALKALVKDISEEIASVEAMNNHLAGMETDLRKEMTKLEGSDDEVVKESLEILKKLLPKISACVNVLKAILKSSTALVQSSGSLIGV